MKLRAVGAITRIVIACGSIAMGWAVLNFGTLNAPPVMAASKPRFDEDIAPILQKNCLPCHSAAKQKSQLVIESYASLMKGGKHGNTIVPGNAAGSRLVGMLEGRIHPRMPEGANPLPAAQIAVIKDWIDAGAEGPPQP
jgi:cytochrome c